MTAAPPRRATVRAYDATDAPTLARLFHETVHAVAAGDYTADQLRAWSPATPDPAAWHARMAARATLVAELDGAIVGFAALEPPDHLDLLYVHKDFQGRGVASVLLAAIEARVPPGIARLVTEASLTARPFFAARGFRLVREEIVARAGVGLRRFVMAKPLGR